MNLPPIYIHPAVVHAFDAFVAFFMLLMFFHVAFVVFCKILCLFMCHVRREIFSICSCWHLAVNCKFIFWDTSKKVQWTDWPSWQSFMGTIKLNYWYIQRSFIVHSFMEDFSWFYGPLWWKPLKLKNVSNISV